jgi:hypothetical protein
VNKIVERMMPLVEAPKPDYDAALSDVKALLYTVNVRLADHARRQAKNPTNPEFAKDLAKAKRQLEDLSMLLQG